MKFQIPYKFLFTHFMERSEHKMWRAYFALTILWQGYALLYKLGIL
jgi:hypothetical protein